MAEFRLYFHVTFEHTSFLVGLRYLRQESVEQNIAVLYTVTDRENIRNSAILKDTGYKLILTTDNILVTESFVDIVHIVLKLSAGNFSEEIVCFEISKPLCQGLRIVYNFLVEFFLIGFARRIQSGICRICGNLVPSF